ncbi:MAG TPA: S-adenosylmethionine:tRNA ribosyltransferase-isomerase, partial [bacterium]|nr:S-adenosylmethionine:tRNA ribosyltransferase-isomerase [bacterium]
LAGVGPTGEPLEVRLAGELEPGAFRAIVFGPGDWRARTEDRAVPSLRVGDRLNLGPLRAVVEGLELGRLLRLRFEARGESLWRAIYAHGRPIQYSYLREALAPWDAQTAYGARPWAVESPSAGRPLTLGLLSRLAARGVQVRALTHAAGLSSTGDAAVDALLPFDERFEIPARTADAVEAARREGRRVVAVGTTVVRALEGCAAANGGEVRAGSGVTSLRLGAESPRRVVDALFTGMHEPGTSHFALLEAFADRALLETAWRTAEGAGYLAHEFGDSALVLASRP